MILVPPRDALEFLAQVHNFYYESSSFLPSASVNDHEWSESGLEKQPTGSFVG